MAGSNWNLLLDRLLAEKLTLAEHRLVLALARLLLGWNRDGTHLGEALIRSTSGLDGRTFVRARQGLIEKGLLQYIPGRGGRGNRGHYQLVLETPAVERGFEALETPALGRAISPNVNPRSHDTKTPAVERGRRGRGKGKNSAQSANTDFRRAAFDAYLSTGGSLLLERERGALARNVSALLKAGVDETTILAACRDLGRERTFPGYLKQRAQEIADRGGPCEHERLDRSRMTATQLDTCGCPLCEEWSASLRGEAVTATATRPAVQP